MSGPRYVADPETLLSSIALDGLDLVFHAPSGMTHILATPSPEILEALREGPADAAQLLARLRRRFDFEEDEAIHARLDELEAAGLVRRA